MAAKLPNKNLKSKSPVPGLSIVPEPISALAEIYQTVGKSVPDGF